jgi:hypothetical protein
MRCAVAVIQVNLKNVIRVRAKGRDYFYLRIGPRRPYKIGPRLPGEPGSPEFMAAAGTQHAAPLSAAAPQPWLDEGICRRTWQRRRAKAQRQTRASAT